MRSGWLVLAAILLVAPSASVAAGTTSSEIPHVIVGVPDTGINPYHQQFYKPDDPRLDDHPCTYIPDFPCSVEKLDLSLEKAQNEGFNAAFQADEDTWESLETDTWYWIPETPFVAVYCEPEDQRGGAVSDGSSQCILDKGSNHGTGTTSSVLSENPEALLAFKQGGSSVHPFESGSIPVDIYSVSWGYVAPLPFSQPSPAIYVKAAGNDPRPTPSDGWSGHPDVIAVGGGYREDVQGPYGYGTIIGGEEETLAAKQPDVVGPFCRPVAKAESSDGKHEACGTSFSAPTAAGALSKVVLEVRKDSGYTGTLDGELVDPEAGLTEHELRTAMNRTASYDPPGGGNPEIPPDPYTAIPLNPAAPWLQWGWGFYNGDVAEDTVAHLLDDSYTHPQKSEAARTYMHTVYTARHVHDPFGYEGSTSPQTPGLTPPALQPPTPSPAPPELVIHPIDRGPTLDTLIGTTIPAS